MVADIAILFDILNPADMGWITKCHHRMQLLILRQSKQLRQLLPVARAYDTASDAYRAAVRISARISSEMGFWQNLR